MRCLHQHQLSYIYIYIYIYIIHEIRTRISINYHIYNTWNEVPTSVSIIIYIYIYIYIYNTSRISINEPVLMHYFMHLSIYIECAHISMNLYKFMKWGTCIKDCQWSGKSVDAMVETASLNWSCNFSGRAIIKETMWSLIVCRSSAEILSWPSPCYKT
jgi:hypothetical protein